MRPGSVGHQERGYGAASARICRQFQKEKGLRVDGVVGPITWRSAWTAPITP